MSVPKAAVANQHQQNQEPQQTAVQQQRDGQAEVAGQRGISLSMLAPATPAVPPPPSISRSNKRRRGAEAAEQRLQQQDEGLSTRILIDNTSLCF